MPPHRAARVRFKSLASKPHTPLDLFGLALALLFVGSPVLVLLNPHRPLSPSRFSTS